MMKVNRIVDLDVFNKIINNWDITTDPKYFGKSLLYRVGKGTLIFYLPISMYNFGGVNINQLFYQIKVCGCGKNGDDSVLLGDVLYEIFDFYNKESVKKSDLVFVSTSPTMNYFATINLSEVSKNSLHLKSLRFKDFLHLQLKVDRVTNVSNNNYILFTKMN